MFRERFTDLTLLGKAIWVAACVVVVVVLGLCVLWCYGKLSRSDFWEHSEWVFLGSGIVGAVAGVVFSWACRNFFVVLGLEVERDADAVYPRFKEPRY